MKFVLLSYLVAAKPGWFNIPPSLPTHPCQNFQSHLYRLSSNDPMLPTAYLYGTLHASPSLVAPYETNIQSVLNPTDVFIDFPKSQKFLLYKFWQSREIHLLFEHLSFDRLLNEHAFEIRVKVKYIAKKFGIDAAPLLEVKNLISLSLALRKELYGESDDLYDHWIEGNLKHEAIIHALDETFPNIDVSVDELYYGLLKVLSAYEQMSESAEWNGKLYGNVNGKFSKFPAVFDPDYTSYMCNIQYSKGKWTFNYAKEDQDALVTKYLIGKRDEDFATKIDSYLRDPANNEKRLLVLVGFSHLLEGIPLNTSYHLRRKGWLVERVPRDETPSFN